MAYVMSPEMLAKAAELRRGGPAEPADLAALSKLKLPPPVVADEDVDQKYVLMEIKTSGPTPLYFVRGSIHAKFHPDAALPLIEEFRALGVPYEVLGGGRIAHSVANKTIRVYGLSNGFPWEGGVSKAGITAELLRKQFPGYEVTVDE